MGHLLVTFGLVRRLRAHTDLLDQLAGESDRVLPAGTPIPSFTAQTTGGDTITEAGLRHPAAVALLAVDCPHCRTNLPEFVAYVRGGGFPRDGVLAVVADSERTDDTARQDMLDALGPVATVVCESGMRGPVATAFDVQGFPVFYLTGPDGTIATGHHAVRRLPNTALASESDRGQAVRES
ncbi:TlpA disulfide reductase family protein [Streptomyces sp. NPDC054849]